jgi:hypothetical protein
MTLINARKSMKFLASLWEEQDRKETYLWEEQE